MKNADIVRRLDGIIDSLENLKEEIGIPKASNSFNNALEKLVRYRNDTSEKSCPHCEEDLN